MYGLMKARVCSSNAQTAKSRRLHYCGTCKTMGSLYGQKARMLLNNDAVFLAELLTALAPESLHAGAEAEIGPEGWSGALQSYNCLAMPKDKTQIPLPLQIAATATLVMSEFKVADQVTDSAGSGWKMIGKIYSQSFLDAAAQMRSWGFPVAKMWDWNRVQEEREMSAVRSGGTRSPDEVLTSVAEPTAVMTALTFEHGARLIGASTGAQETMYGLGHAFGTLIFVLDAYEDDEIDVRKGDFNALQAAYGVAAQRLTEEQRKRAVATLQAACERIEQKLAALPIASAKRSLFVSRLHANLSQRLGVSFGCRTGACTTRGHAVQRGFSTRWNAAHSTAGLLLQTHRAECAGLMSTLQAPFLFLLLFFVALIFPRQAMVANSARECLGMLFNLMFWGAALNAVIALPQRRLAPAHHMSGGQGPLQPGIGHSSSGPHGPYNDTVVTPIRQRRRIGCCCNCCSWECECCCDGCDCACCACQGIECCSEGCDCCSSCG